MTKNKITKDNPNNVRLKDENGNYIFHRLRSRTKGFVIETFGDDPTRCMKALDEYYFEYRRRLASGRVRSGTQFDYFITRTNGPLQEECIVNYIPGSSSNRKFVSYDEDEYDEYDYFDEYEDEYADY